MCCCKQDDHTKIPPLWHLCPFKAICALSRPFGRCPHFLTILVPLWNASHFYIIFVVYWTFRFDFKRNFWSISTNYNFKSCPTLVHCISISIAILVFLNYCPHITFFIVNTCNLFTRLVLLRIHVPTILTWLFQFKCWKYCDLRLFHMKRHFRLMYERE